RGAAAQRCSERALVEIVELAAHRDAMGEPRDLDVEGCERVGDVMRGGLAIDRGVQGEHHLPGAAFGHAPHELLDAELLRADAVERRERAAEHMIARLESAGALESPQISNVGDDDEEMGVTPLIAANAARRLGVDIAAARAE